MPRILDHRTIVRDGKHHAFPSITFWQGQYWVACRSADRHEFSPGAYMSIFVSEDRKRWHRAATVKAPSDNRDATVMAYGNQLALMFVVTTPGETDTLTQQHIAFSDNGYDWQTPVPSLNPRDHLFRTREHEGSHYGVNIRRDQSRSGISLMQSANLIDWKTIAPIGNDDMLLNETDLLFRPDGELWIVARTKRKPDNAMFGIARPPYTDWQFTDLGCMVHAPLMLQRGDEVLMCGRCRPTDHGNTLWPFGNTLCIWRVTRGAIEPIMTIPAVRDCAYAGWLIDPAGRVCMTYYSQHAYYLGVVEPCDAKVCEDPTGFASDLFYVELNLND